MNEPKAPDLTDRPQLTWMQAVEAMQADNYVRRASQMYWRCVEPECGLDGAYETGQEGCYLAHAWTEDNRPVRIFMGAISKCLFVPDGDHLDATDWVVVDKQEARS